MKILFTILVLFFTGILCRAQTLYFPPLSGNTWDTISPQSLNWCQNRIDSLYNYLNTNNTKAFILLKDGKIVLEKYFNGHTQNSLWQWASAGKTITAFMVGIAQQEGYLSINDTTSDVLGAGWTFCTPAQENKITIRHQLTMTSGLDDAVTDPYCTIDSCLICYADAGTRWAYHNAPYTLLDSVLHNATGQSLNTYTTQKLKNPTGMTGTFYPVGFNNVYFSNARSMARFGLLCLNKANWNGTQIMTDTSYFNQMVNTSQNLNLSYGYLWWLNGKATYMLPGSQNVFPGPMNPNAPADMFAAMGKDGQFLNVIPGRNMVWVRMGDAPGGLPVPFLMNDQIWEFINVLECDSTGMPEAEGESSITIFPNPAIDLLHINTSGPVDRIDLLNTQGLVIQSIRNPDHQIIIPVDKLPAGIYFVSFLLPDGRVLTKKLVKVVGPGSTE